MNWFSLVWLVLLIVFIGAEVSTVAMVSVWFAVGALTATVASLLHAPLWLQLVLFFGVSGICLGLLRPWAQKYFNPKTTRTNADSVVGTTGIVTEDIDNIKACGQVKLGAMVWTARSTSGEVILKGVRVRADRIEGVKIYVTPVELPQ